MMDLLTSLTDWLDKQKLNLSLCLFWWPKNVRFHGNLNHGIKGPSVNDGVQAMTDLFHDNMMR